MSNEFVPYSIAKKLKDLGFDKPCFCYYGEINGGEVELFQKKEFDNKCGNFVLAPLWQQAFEWFRESKKTQITVDIGTGGKFHFYVWKWNEERVLWEKHYNFSTFDSYVEASENAIEETLKIK